MLAASESELQEMMDRMERACKKYELQINSEKTKAMTTSETLCNIRCGNSVMEQVDTYAYLGSRIIKDGDCGKEIRSRLAKGYAITTQLKSLWQNHGISNTTKVKLLRPLVWPVATYGCKSWTMRKRDETKIRAFEMKCLGHVLHISWIEGKTNEWVLHKAKTERQLLQSIRKRKLTYFGHMIRKKEESLE